MLDEPFPILLFSLKKTMGKDQHTLLQSRRSLIERNIKKDHMTCLQSYKFLIKGMATEGSTETYSRLIPSLRGILNKVWLTLLLYYHSWRNLKGMENHVGLLRGGVNQ
jgi:hypothetical protein